MSSRAVFVESPSDKSKDGKDRRGSNVTIAVGRRKDGSGEESSTTTASAAQRDFDVFEYLNEAEKSSDLLRDPILQRMTVVRYEGDVNDQGFFHGKGTLVSTLGYTYTGELDRGLMHGSGTISWSNGVSFTGGFKNNVPHGKGKYQWNNGDWYEGEVVDAVRSGKGTFFYNALKATYDGKWLKGMRHGKGELCYSETSKYIGEWSNDKKDGRGLMQYSTGDRYDGEWKADKRHGFGVMVWTTNGNVVEVYKGEWADGVQHGDGFSMYIRPPANAAPNSNPPPSTEGALGDVVPPRDAAVNTYRGKYNNGLRHGFGAFTYDDGSKYEGMWREHQKHGEGKFTTSTGVVSIDIYEHGTPVTTPQPVTPGSTAEGTTKDVAAAAALTSSSLAVQATVPLYIRDVLGPNENNVPEAVQAVQSILSRHNGLMRRIFNTYATMDTSVALLLTPTTWRRDRTQGTMALIQFLRCLSDAKLINTSLTVAVVDRLLTHLTDRNAPPAADSTPPPTAATSSSPAAAIKLPPAALSTPWAQYKNQLHLFTGELSFRDFTEAVVRIAAVMYADDAYGPIASKLTVVIEEHLAPLTVQNPATSGSPLCPSTRAHGEHIAQSIPMLQDLFIYFSGTTSLGQNNKASCVLPERSGKATSSASSGNVGITFKDSLSRLAGVTMTVRQFLLMLKEAGAMNDDRFSVGKALHALFPYDRYPAFTSALHKKRLLPPQTTSVVPQPPRGDQSDRASTVSEPLSSVAPFAAASAVSATGLSEMVYRGRWIMQERSKGLHNHNLHATLQSEMELTFVEFAEAVINAAMKQDVAHAPGERVQNFIKSFLAPLHVKYC